MDHATPNLPSRDFLATEGFYGKLGFDVSYRSGDWMILRRGAVKLEFFPWPDLDPYQSNFSCCIRLDDLDAMVKQCGEADIPEARTGIPRLVPLQKDMSGLIIAYLVDPDGSLPRLIQNC